MCQVAAAEFPFSLGSCPHMGAMRAGRGPHGASSLHPRDHVELQGSAAAEITQFEQLRIDEIRRQIAAGTYLTDHKLDVVADVLFAVLQAEARSAEGVGEQR